MKGKLGSQTGAAAAPRPACSAKSWESPFEGATAQERLIERAHEDREIVHFLQQPETHAFRLYHDYAESRPGADKYFNVVRTGSKVSGPSAYVLDTGEKLATRTTTGAELASAKIDAGEPVDTAAHGRGSLLPAESGTERSTANLRNVHSACELPTGGRRVGL